ncbi:hypothetical protein H6F93_31435 [Leptolyngbya sp. FACHB-671]|uniref:hypothetical protein n=1 Tax=Leptolyngbya sp. FACHB-671 TaxID=2692812 RepID=UPI001683FCA4|nr:hypothetical protein [Leptolyngbya sp. FACHB-671]MBD2071982.1 hypothetical protein [Leptolyngbya sp. FACHB-671]
MERLSEPDAPLDSTSSFSPEQPTPLKRLRGGFLLVLGYLLSPLSWWNDLFFNLPFAYGLGYLASRFSPDFFLPAAIAGYWLSNVAGILLMQLGIMDVFQGEAKERNLKKELITGVVSSTVYTLIILGLIHLHILETPGLDLEGSSFSLSVLWPFGGDR